MYFFVTVEHTSGVQPLSMGQCFEVGAHGPKQGFFFVCLFLLFEGLFLCFFGFFLATRTGDRTISFKEMWVGQTWRPCMRLKRTNDRESEGNILRRILSPVFRFYLYVLFFFKYTRTMKNSSSPVITLFSAYSTLYSQLSNYYPT